MKKQVFFTIFLLFATLFVSAQTMWSARYDSDGAYEAQANGIGSPQTLIDGASNGDVIIIYNEERLAIDPLEIGVEVTIEYNYADSYTPLLDVGEVYNPTTGEIWMDRNLGASQVATSSTDANAYGDLYQWGRAADGHESRTSGTTSTLSNTDTPGHANFITTSNSPFDWRSPQNDNLWQGVSCANNPCPSGYRLPTEAEWQAELDTWSSNDAAGAIASPLKLPMAGRREYNDGSLYNVGSFGYYWSSNLDGAASRHLLFLSGKARMSELIRAYGASVRCIKD